MIASRLVDKAKRVAANIFHAAVKDMEDSHACEGKVVPTSSHRRRMDE